MNDKMYQSVKWLTIGILLGYAGKYALALFKAKQDQDNSFGSNNKKETIFSNDDEDANEY